MTTARATAFYGSFLGSWFGGSFITAALILCPVWGWFFDPRYFLACWLVYGAQRFVFPLRESDAFKKRCSFASNEYFDAFDMKFDGCTEAELDGSTKRLFGFHPHGILLCGWTMAIADERTHGWSAAWLATKWVTFMPLVSEWMVSLGVQAVQSDNFKRLLSSGKNICMAVGGFEEATYFEHGKYKVFLKGRGGFIKYCLKHGYRIHPVFTFGEERTFRTVSAGLKWRLLLNKISLPGVIFLGRWLLCPFMPVPTCKLTTVVGGALKDMPHIPEPTRDDVAKWAKVYEAELRSLFERNRAKYALDGDAATLEVF